MSPVAEMYARRVMRGVMAVSDVPAPWREAARAIVERERGGEGER